MNRIQWTMEIEQTSTQENLFALNTAYAQWLDTEHQEYFKVLQNLKRNSPC